MAEKNRKLIDECASIYEASRNGQSAVLDYCEEIEHDKYGPCYACEYENSPLIEDGNETVCLVCSSCQP